MNGYKTCLEPKPQLSCHTSGKVARLAETINSMHRKPPTNWLNLLLAMILVLGPWPVLAGFALGDGCCTTAMESTPAGQDRCCERDHAQESPCVDHCCPAAHCATAVFLPSNIDIVFSQYGNWVPPRLILLILPALSRRPLLPPSHFSLSDRPAAEPFGKSF